jgi:hypothetical protein
VIGGDADAQASFHKDVMQMRSLGAPWESIFGSHKLSCSYELSLLLATFYNSTVKHIVNICIAADNVKQTEKQSEKIRVTVQPTDQLSYKTAYTSSSSQAYFIILEKSQRIQSKKTIRKQTERKEVDICCIDKNDYVDSTETASRAINNSPCNKR